MILKIIAYSNYMTELIIASTSGRYHSSIIAKGFIAIVTVIFIS